MRADGVVADEHNVANEQTRSRQNKLGAFVELQSDKKCQYCATA
jgi:hypothetical protein